MNKLSGKIFAALNRAGIAVDAGNFSETFVISNTSTIFIEVGQFAGPVPINNVERALRAIIATFEKGKVCFADFGGGDLFKIPNDPSSQSLAVVAGRIKTKFYNFKVSVSKEELDGSK